MPPSTLMEIFMKHLMAFLLLASAAFAQAVIPPPDIPGAVTQMNNTINQANFSAAQAALLRQQAALIRQQNRVLMEQSAGQSRPGQILPTSGNVYLSRCEKEQARPIECFSYVAGVVDGLKMMQVPMYCAPDGVTYAQDVRIAVKYMQYNPKYLAAETRYLVTSALVDAFPCPVNNRSGATEQQPPNTPQ
jgi:hypothetical protein